MGGVLNEKVDRIASEFNESQQEFIVKPVYKGNYTETMTAGVAAFRAKKHPHIIQVFEVGTATMMAATRAVYPVYQLMNDAGEKFYPQKFLQAVTGYYTDSDNNMYSMPFNSSTPVLYYNKDALDKQGVSLSSSEPPSWYEIEKIAKKAQEDGYECGITVGWQSWTQLENYAAVHNLEFSSLSNGFDGLDTKLNLDQEHILHHVGRLREWQKTNLFSYGGRRSDAAPKFYNAECVFYINSSASYSSVDANVKKFKFSVAPLPYYPEIEAKPKNSIIGGASLWVLRGHAPASYRGVARFFTFLTSPEIQARWHQETGYLPVTIPAYELTKEQGFYLKNPGTDTAILQMTRVTPTKNSKGLRIGNFVQIRDVINEELEAIWAGSKTASEGLKDATRRSNKLVDKFLRRNF